MPPMLNRAASRHGSCCGGPPGIDCADYSKTKGQQRRIEKRQWERQEGFRGRGLESDDRDDV